jgi:hypothetical protein
VMANRLQPGTCANPTGPESFELDEVIGCMFAETIRASGHEHRTSKAGHMTASSQASHRDLSLQVGSVHTWSHFF